MQILGYYYFLQAKTRAHSVANYIFFDVFDTLRVLFHRKFSIKEV